MLARLLFFCGLFMASTSAMAMTIYKSTDANGVVSYSDRPTKGSSVFTFRDRMVENLERQVYLVIMKKDGVDSVYVRNDLYAPVEIELSFTGLKNVSGAPSRPIRRVMPLRSSIRLAQLTADQGRKAARVSPQVRIFPGRPRRRRHGLSISVALAWRAVSRESGRRMASTATSARRTATPWTSPCRKARRSSPRGAGWW